MEICRTGEIPCGIFYANALCMAFWREESAILKLIVSETAVFSAFRRGGGAKIDLKR